MEYVGKPTYQLSYSFYAGEVLFYVDLYEFGLDALCRRAGNIQYAYLPPVIQQPGCYGSPEYAASTRYNCPQTSMARKLIVTNAHF